jgi:hypothetical protein
MDQQHLDSRKQKDRLASAQRYETPVVESLSDWQVVTVSGTTGPLVKRGRPQPTPRRGN